MNLNFFGRLGTLARRRRCHRLRAKVGRLKQTRDRGRMRFACSRRCGSGGDRRRGVGPAFQRGVASAWPIFVSYANRPSRLHFSLHQRRPPPTRSFSVRCSPPSPARSARSTAIKYLVDMLSRRRQRRRLDGVRPARLADRRRQSAVAGRQLDRQLRVRRRHRRPAPRPVPSSDGPFARLFRRSPARHPDEPGDRDLECGVHRREYVRLERAAAMRGNRRGDRTRVHHQPADGRGARRRRRRHGRDRCSASPPPDGRCTTTSPARRPQSTAR